MTFPYAPLLQPLQIGKLTIKNRFCVGPLTLPSLHGPFWGVLRERPGLL